MKTRMGVLLFISLLALALAAPSAQAQSMFATLTGTVQDSAGAVIVGAGVTVRNMASGETRVATTNKGGYFSIPELPAETYQVIIVAKGFEKYRASGIALSGGDTRSMNIQLKVGAATETVEVTSPSSVPSAAARTWRSRPISNRRCIPSCKATWSTSARSRPRWGS